MIILDTNVLSEIIKPAASAKVVAWADANGTADLVTTSVSKAEMLAGAEVLDEGTRKRRLMELIAAVLHPLESTMLSFDTSAAAVYGAVVAKRRRLGKPIGQMDAQIAAIALSRSASLATRDVDDFVGLGLDIINPWNA